MNFSEKQYQAMLKSNGGPDGIAVLRDPGKVTIDYSQVQRQAGALGQATAQALESPLPAPTEHAEQVALFQWADMAQVQYPELAMLFAVPNGGYRPMTTAAQLKAEGVRAGVPDIFLMCRRRYYGALAIELKRVDHSNHATVEQAEWIERLREYGYMAVVCYGAQEAIDTITAYLNDNRDY